MGHELIGDLFSESRLQAAAYVDRGELLAFAILVGSQFPAF
jgi:hypothetical protein